MKTDLWNYLKETKKPIVLYGMGDGADKIIKVLEQRGIHFNGVFASSGFVRKKIFHGFTVTEYNTLKQQFSDMIVLLCFGSARQEVIENVKKISLEQELYAPDVPVYGDTLFDLEYAKQNERALTLIYNSLADDISKLTFKNTVLYKITGDIKYLFECEVSPNEPYNTFLKLTDDEIFMDLGAYRGDTVKDFLSRVKNHKNIYAVEPDVKTYNKLIKECGGVKNIEFFNGCISNEMGRIIFNMNSSRGSSIGNNGIEIDALSVDGILKTKGVTLIKMDVEGEEKNAILGAKNTILMHKPKMQISCYHKSEDLIELIDTVNGIRGDYSIYMRHFPSLPAWDTCYYFI